MSTILNRIAVVALVLGVVASTSPAEAGCGGGGYFYRPIYRPPVIVHHGPPIIVHPPFPAIGAPFPSGPVAGAPAPGTQPISTGAPAPKAGMRLLDLRLVDPGDPGRKLGPRFRLFFANKGQVASKPFDLMLAAGLDKKFDPAYPSVVERVLAIKANHYLAVDMRLPFESLMMKYPGKDKPAPFSMLFVMIGGQKDLKGTASFKPISSLDVHSLKLVDLSPEKVADAKAAAGSVITLYGEGYGFTPGKVTLSLANLKLNAEIVNWGPMGIQVKLPALNMTAAAKAELTIARGDGMTAKLSLTIIPAKAPAPPVQPVNPLLPPPAAGGQDPALPPQEALAPPANEQVPAPQGEGAPKQSDGEKKKGGLAKGLRSLFGAG